MGQDIFYYYLKYNSISQGSSHFYHEAGLHIIIFIKDAFSYLKIGLHTISQVRDALTVILRQIFIQFY